MVNRDEFLRSAWAEYLRVVRGIWEIYLHQGPGGVPLDQLEPLNAAAVFLDEISLDRDRYPRDPKSTPDSKRDPIEIARRLQVLARRCVEKPEGLCFVTGEAGLIRRADLHEEFESGLKILASYVDGDFNESRD